MRPSRHGLQAQSARYPAPERRIERKSLRGDQCAVPAHAQTCGIAHDQVAMSDLYTPQDLRGMPCVVENDHGIGHRSLRQELDLQPGARPYLKARGGVHAGRWRNPPESLERGALSTEEEDGTAVLYADGSPLVALRPVTNAGRCPECAGQRARRWGANGTGRQREAQQGKR